MHNYPDSWRSTSRISRNYNKLQRNWNPIRIAGMAFVLGALKGIPTAY